MSQHLLTFEVTAPRDGYLTLINAGEGEEESVVLFPNRYQPDNRVTKDASYAVATALFVIRR